ncbi:MAG: flagellar hook-associated protein FlgK [Deltaproteobacteria bacterium]|nr:flagellar hook-associated protein FlgK [Deltaproteobacteria bacterium]
MAITDILEMGRQGMMANRQALQTTAQNVANANTPDYSRQKPVMEAHEQSVHGGTRVGGGVEVKKVIRVHDQFIQNHLLEESKALGQLKSRSDGLRLLEGIIGEQGTDLGNLMTKFFNDVRELSVNPGTASSRAVVSESADAVAFAFRRLSDSLSTIQKDIDTQIEHTVLTTNSMAKELAEMNIGIVRAQAMGQSPNELLDRRDVLERQITEKLGYEILHDERNLATVIAPGVGVLVQGERVNELRVRRTPEEGQKGPGALDVFLGDGNSEHRLTKSISQGEIGGLISVRDAIINPAAEHLDQVAYQFAQSVNQAHRQGMGMDGTSGRDLFTEAFEASGSAGRIALNQDIKNNNLALAVGYGVEDPSDNRVALEMSDIQSKALLSNALTSPSEGDGRYTLGESINEIIGTVGVHTQRTNQMFDHQKAIVDQLDNYRQSVSGVSLEEEAIQMMQFQTAFNAASKMIRVGDELLEEVLKLR